ncbi:hypothetical protein [Neisseria sp.]|uniref:hypothetical protein n=1 Tax=Neisseria sp. TaxID=192066 RepID=UPI0026DD27F8|nr:hypothetical protein [Neisseria sp.]MDO4907943.1 hypothetical protein [Neisseria sp.]
MDYNFAQTIHLLAAVAAAGPLLFAPYLSLRLKSCKEEEKILILRSLTMIDRYYNIAGWGLILSGIFMLWSKEWYRIFQLWFILSVLVFIVDSIVEKLLRDPSNRALSQLHPKAMGWGKNAAKMHKAVIIQAICTLIILLIMLLHSRLQINLLSISPLYLWFDS